MNSSYVPLFLMGPPIIISELGEFLYLPLPYFLTLVAFGNDKIPARRGIVFILFSQQHPPAVRPRP